MPGLRPIQHLEDVSRSYPGVWKNYAMVIPQLRARGTWPAWCFCPMAAAYAIVAGGGQNRVPLERMHEVSRVAALAAWRATQGIYRFEPALLEELRRTPLQGDLPSEHLKRLPEWCVYVEFDSPTCVGFFAFLESDLTSSRPSLKVLLDEPNQKEPLRNGFKLYLDVGTLDDSIASLLESAIGRLQGGLTVPAALQGTAQVLNNLPNDPGTFNKHLSYIRELAEPVVSTLLYLCAGDAEMRPTRDPKRQRTLLVATPKRNGELQLPAARRPEVWETGFQLGLSLRAANASSLDDGKGRRGHIRRAHWHSYWLGSGDSRRLALRWLPPIAVNLVIPDQPTMHQVKPLR